MLGPAQKHGQPIPQEFLGKVFRRHGVVPFQPLFGPELFEGRKELRVDIRPSALRAFSFCANPPTYRFYDLSLSNPPA